MNYEEMTIEELNAELKTKLHSCAIWKSTTDGSYEMALHSSGYYEVQKIISLKRTVEDWVDMEKGIADLEEFYCRPREMGLEVARIPDAQEWRRKELRGHSL